MSEVPPMMQEGACPVAEVVAAYVDGTLEAVRRRELEQHLVGCVDCRDVIAASFLSGPAAERAVHAPWSRRALLGGAGALLAAAAILLLAIRAPRGSGETDLVRLLQAFDGHRPIEARLSVDMPYRPPPRATRAGGSPDVPPDVRIAAARIEKAAEADASAANLHAAGIARLVSGDAGGAAEALERLARLSPGPAIFADLSAATLVDGVRTGNVAQLSRAHASAERAVQLDPARLDALFNAALAAEYAGDRAEAIRDWDRYLMRDAASAWADEARLHVSRLRTQP